MRTERRSYRHVRWGEWLLMMAAVVALVVGLQQTNLLARADQLLQDALVRMATRDVSQSQVVLVGIDDKSIATLGRWPWPRTLHAELLDRISAGNPAAIGLDILLVEPDTREPENDRHLAEAARLGLDVTVVDDPTLMWDVDVPGDLSAASPTVTGP